MTKNKIANYIGLSFLLLFSFGCNRQISPPSGQPTKNQADFIDFNQDGFADFVVGIPQENQTEGMVQVVYGDAFAFLETGEIWTKNSFPGETAQPGDHFGYSVQTADFNGDGFTDLAIGAPLGKEGSNIFFLFGSTSGLAPKESISISRGEEDSNIGKTLAAGDFNGDGFDDLVFGSPDFFIPIVGDANRVGAIGIAYGQESGIDPLFIGLKGNELTGDIGDLLLGSSLIVSDFNADGLDDIVAGASGGNAVYVLYGIKDKQFSLGDPVQKFQQGLATQGSDPIQGRPEAKDQFGFSLSAGDYNGDGFADLAVSAPGESHSGVERAGVVHLIYGTKNGLQSVLNQMIFQGFSIVFGTDKISGVPEKGDRFGFALTSGNFNNDRYTDLAIGVPFEDAGQTQGAGAVQVLFGSQSRLSSKDNQLFFANSPEIGSRLGESNHFGFSLTAGQFDTHPGSDLAIGTIREDVGQEKNAGAIYLLSGRQNNTLVKLRTLQQGERPLADRPEREDQFGFALPQLPTKTVKPSNVISQQATEIQKGKINP